MFEKVNPSHPDKVADRIAGALVDLAYKKQDNPRIAVEVLIGHSKCMIIAETSVHNTYDEVLSIVNRIAGPSLNNKEILLDYVEVPQDQHLADNQAEEIRCGDNGIFKGVPMTKEQIELTLLAHHLYTMYPYDGKYIITQDKFEPKYIICHSNVHNEDIDDMCSTNSVINPLGYWTGGLDVDSGATNRKLGSDMGDSVTGGGLHGKDLSKADVSVNIYCFQKAQETRQRVLACCAIGDDRLTFNYDDFSETLSYREVVEFARKYIEDLGGFEKFAEWGLI